MGQMAGKVDMQPETASDGHVLTEGGERACCGAGEEDVVGDLFKRLRKVVPRAAMEESARKPATYVRHALRMVRASWCASTKRACLGGDTENVTSRAEP